MNIFFSLQNKTSCNYYYFFLKSVLQNSMAASYENRGPITNYRLEMSIFYIVYFIVFPFFFVNIFVALIIITFQEQGEAELQDGGIDKNQVSFPNRSSLNVHLLICPSKFQKSCIDFAISARPFATYIPQKQKKLKYKVWKMVVSTPFDYFIMLLIILNTLLLMMKVFSRNTFSFQPEWVLHTNTRPTSEL